MVIDTFIPTCEIQYLHLRLTGSSAEEKFLFYCLSNLLLNSSSLLWIRKKKEKKKQYFSDFPLQLFNTSSHR